MIINNLKINGYGKLENKEIQLQNGINIINGNNESGKSTLLNFIFSMFFGASKNKNGKDISDYDKYKPWNANEFSGKIKYTLDSNRQIEVFRDFSKKNPQIYNENLENISDNFNIDKTKGNQFFVEQTGIDESLFMNTMTVGQNEVILDDSKQNILIQKITNAVSSGDDNTSYKKTIDKLNKKMLEEVGTNRTSGRPINIIEEEIEKLEADKNDLELYKTRTQNIETEKQETENNMINVQNELNILKEIKEYKQKEVLEEQKIGININKLNEYNDKIKELKKQAIYNDELPNKKGLNPILMLAICIAIVAGCVAIKNNIIRIILGIISVSIFLINYYFYSKSKKILNSQKESAIKQNKEIEILQENIEQCNKEIQNDRQKIDEKQIQEKQYIINKYGNKINPEEYILQTTEELEEKIEKAQNKYNEIILKENTLSIEKENIDEKLGNLVKQEERLEYLYEQKQELVNLANYIELAQNGLEEAYTKMKNTVTPKFTNELTNIIRNTTSDKYKNIRFNDTEGLMVELENGEYIKCDRLSLGTIDQMYLALRISILNEISKETMPIILDEAFVYYDTERLNNILEYIAKEYKERQIIILTCTNRETESLNKMNIEYNQVNI